MPPAKLRRFFFVASAFLLWLFRSKELFANPQFFLEDGTLFFVDAYNDGKFSLFQSYAGYFVSYQRLVAWSFSFLPIEHLPLCYLVCGSLVSFVFIWDLSANFFPGRWGLLAVLVFIFSPFDGTDTITLTNSQWICGAWLLLFVAFGKMAEGRKGANIILFLIAALTGPFVLILLPLFFLRYIRAREHIDRRWLILSSALALLQAIAIGGLLEPRVSGSFELLNADWVRACAMLLNYPLDLLFGESKSLLESGLILLIGLASYGLLAVLARRYRDTASQYLLMGAILFSASALLAYRSDPSYLLFRPRYALLPTLAVSWAMLSLSARAQKPLLIFALAPFFFSTLLHFFTPPLEDFHWQSASKCIGKESPCEIPLNWKGKIISYDPHRASGPAGRKGYLSDIS